VKTTLNAVLISLLFILIGGAVALVLNWDSLNTTANPILHEVDAITQYMGINLHRKPDTAFAQKKLSNPIVQENQRLKQKLHDLQESDYEKCKAEAESAASADSEGHIPPETPVPGAG